MTSLAFIGGVFPLVIATGAGAEMRRSLGTAVFSGMIGVALLGIFLTPVLLVLMRFGGPKRPSLLRAIPGCRAYLGDSHAENAGRAGWAAYWVGRQRRGLNR